MNFRDGIPIFLQIVESVENRILDGEWAAENRIPAVRDIAIALEVNPNTVVRSFQELETSGVLFKKRGLGCYVAPNARESILQRRRKAFWDVEFPALARTLSLLEISPSALAEAFTRPRAEDTLENATQGTTST